ncbi:hypothetical protein R1sor_013561 [Riccia sorocarpa]|uniref:MULE transposase domain-containing protein n=1 Tax=Riccia sorocarpa TaxID=122646 RepID=A0ABD3H9V6_9MARC
MQQPTPRNGFAGVDVLREGMTDEALANSCNWRVRGKVANDTTVVITVCELVHTCPSHLHSWRASATAKWLANVLGNQVINNPSIFVTQLQDVFRNEYGRQTSYKAMWKGKEAIMDHIQGSESSSFQCIPAFCETLKVLDPGAYAEWETYPSTRHFWRIFVCPTALGRAFPHLRPHIGLDACHSKNHKFPGQVLLATAMDGNNHVNYLAYAVVDKENEENWTWFLLLLCRAVVGIKAVRYKQVLQAITATSAECGLYVGNIDPKTYTAYAVPLPRFGHTTSNLVEVANSCILPLRAYAPFKLCYQLYLYLMELKARRQKEAAEMQGLFTPYASNMLRKHEEFAGSYRVRMV